MKVDTARYKLRRMTGSGSDRIGGSKPQFTDMGYICGHLSEIEDAYSVKSEGAHREVRYSIIVRPQTDIRPADRVIISGEEYSVVQLLNYSTHRTAVLEKVVSAWLG